PNDEEEGAVGGRCAEDNAAGREVQIRRQSGRAGRQRPSIRHLTAGGLELVRVRRALLSVGQGKSRYLQRWSGNENREDTIRRNRQGIGHPQVEEERAAVG